MEHGQLYNPTWIHLVSLFSLFSFCFIDHFIPFHFLLRSKFLCQYHCSVTSPDRGAANTRCGSASTLVYPLRMRTDQRAVRQHRETQLRRDTVETSSAYPIGCALSSMPSGLKLCPTALGHMSASTRGHLRCQRLTRHNQSQSQSTRHSQHETRHGCLQCYTEKAE